MKHCFRCNTSKSLDEFPPNRSKKDGHGEYCIPCTKTYNEEYRTKNIERIKKKKQEYYQENREHIDAKNTAWAKANPERRNEIFREWYAKNSEIHIQRTLSWAASHPEKVRQIAIVSESRKRTRRNNDLHDDLSPAQWREILEYFEYKCVYCPKTCEECIKKTHKLTMDHIIPASKNGSTTASNIVPSCRRCNAKKHVGPPPCHVEPIPFTVSPPRKRRRHPLTDPAP